MLQAQHGSKTKSTLGFKLFTVIHDMHPLGQARLLLLQKEVKQLPSTQAFPPTKNPPWRRRKSGWGAANAKHSGSGEATFPLSHPPLPFLQSKV